VQHATPLPVKSTTATATPSPPPQRAPRAADINNHTTAPEAAGHRTSSSADATLPPTTRPLEQRRARRASGADGASDAAPRVAPPRPRRRPSPRPAPSVRIARQPSPRRRRIKPLRRRGEAPVSPCCVADRATRRSSVSRGRPPAAAGSSGSPCPPRASRARGQRHTRCARQGQSW